MGKPIAAAAIAALIAALLLAGCGEGEEDGAGAGQASAGNGSASSDPEPATSDSDSPQATGEEGTTIAKAEFVRKADAICKATYEELEKKTFATLDEASPKERKAVEARLLTTVMAPLLSEEVAQIRALGSPAGDEERVEAILEGLTQAVEKIEADPEALVGGRVGLALEDPAAVAGRYGVSCPFG